MKRTIVPIFWKEEPFAGSVTNQESRRAEEWLRLALHDAALKRYIFTFSGNCPMQGKAMVLLYGCVELLDEVSRSTGRRSYQIHTSSKAERRRDTPRLAAWNCCQ
ncbi:hypothetical protein CO667_21950, partial [Rhizobium sp. L43]